MLRNLLFNLYNLNLKKALGVSFILSLFLSVPLIYLLLQREGMIFTEAGREDRPPSSIVDESKVPYPELPPQIIYIDKYYGKPGDSILIYGKNFGAAQKDSKILLNNKTVRKDDIVYWSDDEIEFSLPNESSLYQVTVSINGKRTVWDGLLNVFAEDTSPKIVINEKTGFIKAETNDLNLKITALNDNIRVFGTDKFIVNTKSIPIELVNSSILYIEVSKNGVAVPFKVDLQ